MHVSRNDYNIHETIYLCTTKIIKIIILIKIIIQYCHRPTKCCRSRTSAKSTTVALVEVGCCSSCRLIRRPEVLTVIIVVYHPTGFLYSCEQIISCVRVSVLADYDVISVTITFDQCSKQKY